MFFRHQAKQEDSEPVGLGRHLVGGPRLTPRRSHGDSGREHPLEEGSGMAEDKGFDITTAEFPLIRRDGRAHFARPKQVRVRILEWTLATLWLFVAGVAIAAVV